MKTEPIVPARVQRTVEGLPFSAEFGDVYHPAGGALLQAAHVFLAGNELPARWQRRERFVILDRKSTRLNSSHIQKSRMPSSA